MIERDVEIVNRLGLHARAAAKLVNAAGKYESSVALIKDGDEVDGKSILGVLMLAAGQGHKVTVRCQGVDEEDAIEEIASLISRGFEEGTERR